MAQLEYLTKIMQVIEKIDKEQSENIQAAADLCAALDKPLTLAPGQRAIIQTA